MSLFSIIGILLTITDGNDLWSVSFPDPSQQHYLPVLALKADRTYTVDIDLIPGGRVGTVLATTPALPNCLRTLLVVGSGIWVWTARSRAAWGPFVAARWVANTTA